MNGYILENFLVFADKHYGLLYAGYDGGVYQKTMDKKWYDRVILWNSCPVGWMDLYKE